MNEREREQKIEQLEAEIQQLWAVMVRSKPWRQHSNAIRQYGGQATYARDLPLGASNGIICGHPYEGIREATMHDIIKYLRDIAQTCSRLARACPDLATARGLEEVALDLMAKASELDQLKL